MTEAPNNSFTPPRQQQHSLAKGVAGSKGGFDAGNGDGFGGRVGGKSVSPLMETCPPSMPLLRPSKKPKTTHDGGYLSARQQAKGEHKRKNVRLKPKSALLTQWLRCSGDDDYRPGRVHSGRGSATYSPFFSWRFAEVVDLSCTRGAGLRFPQRKASRYQRELVPREARFLWRCSAVEDRHAGGREP